MRETTVGEQDNPPCNSHLSKRSRRGRVIVSVDLAYWMGQGSTEIRSKEGGKPRGQLWQLVYILTWAAVAP